MRIGTIGIRTHDRHMARIRYMEIIINITPNLKQLNMSLSAKSEMLS